MCAVRRLAVSGLCRSSMCGVQMHERMLAGADTVLLLIHVHYYLIFLF